MKKENKHLNQEEIAICADAINNNTYGDLPEHFRKHLHQCDLCSHEVINVAELSSDIESDKIYPELNNKEKNNSVKNLNFNLVTGIAASIAILVIAMILIFPDMFSKEEEQIAENQNSELNSGKQSITDTAISKDTLIVKKKEIEKRQKKDSDSFKAEKQEKKLLASYQPDPKLEKLHQSMQGTYRGKSIDIKTPAELKTGNENESFLRWENNTNQPLIVEIFDNKGNEIFAEETNKEKCKIPDLSPGLYYWKLIDNDFELLFVGKIFIEQ